MSKELEALEELKVVLKTNIGTKRYSDIFENHLIAPIETALKDYEHSQNQRELYFKQAKELKSKELSNQKKLKALEIIKEKGLDMRELRYCYSLYEYNTCKAVHIEPLTQEEFDLLKEVLL